MAYFDDDDPITCPYCSAEFNKDEFYPGDGDITEVHCECGKTYTIVTSMTRHFTTQCGEDTTTENDCAYEVMLIDEKPKFEVIGGKRVLYAICKRCEETAFRPPETVEGAEKYL